MPVYKRGMAMAVLRHPFGKRLRVLREAALIETAHLADAARLSAGRVDKLERGVSPPHVVEVERLVAALGLEGSVADGLRELASLPLSQVQTYVLTDEEIDLMVPWKVFLTYPFNRSAFRAVRAMIVEAHKA